MAHWRDRILEKLDQYNDIDVEVGDNFIAATCQNPESFTVSLHSHGEEFQVGFGGWHEHFDAEEDALNCFAFGLTKDCRLKVVKRGKMECSWTVQAWQDGTWVDDTETGLIFIPFWRPTQIEYRHNAISRKDD